MGAQQRPDDSVNTALAVTKDDMSALSTDQRALIAQRKNANIVAAQIASTNWGKGLDAPTQRAIADWGNRNSVDVTTEIYVLGGSIYLNAQFYQNRAIDLMARGKVVDYKQRFIQHDPRLEDILREVLPATASDAERAELANAQAEARREIRSRRALRIMHGVPDDEKIKAAVLTEVRLASHPDTPIYGVKWTPHPTSKHNDPVGTDFPQETALTRSARRAWKQVARQVQEIKWAVEGAEEDENANLSELLAAHAERERQAALAPAPESRQLTEGVAVAEYVRSETGEAVPVMNSDQIRHASRMRDPYVPLIPDNSPTSFDDDPFAPDVPKGPVTETLFGTSEPMELTAAEKAEQERQREEAEREANLEEDRRIAAEDEERAKRRRAS
jgi:hypothetical protein